MIHLASALYDGMDCQKREEGFWPRFPWVSRLPFPLTVYYMTANPASYKALEADPSPLPALAAIEGEINGMSVSYVPKEAVQCVSADSVG